MKERSEARVIDDSYIKNPLLLPRLDLFPSDFIPKPLQECLSFLNIPQVGLFVKHNLDKATTEKGALGSTKNDLLSLMIYTQTINKFNVYELLNKAISARSFDLNDWKDFTFHLITAMKKFPMFEGICFKVVPNTIQSSKLYTPGRYICWNSFTSATTSQNLVSTLTEQLKPKEVIIFKINYIHGAKLPKSEFVFEPNSEFEVLSFYKEEQTSTITFCELKQHITTRPLIPNLPPAEIYKAALKASKETSADFIETIPFPKSLIRHHSHQQQIHQPQQTIEKFQQPPAKEGVIEFKCSVNQNTNNYRESLELTTITNLQSTKIPSTPTTTTTTPNEDVLRAFSQPQFQRFFTFGVWIIVTPKEGNTFIIGNDLSLIVELPWISNGWFRFRQKGGDDWAVWMNCEKARQNLNDISLKPLIMTDIHDKLTPVGNGARLKIGLLQLAIENNVIRASFEGGEDDIIFPMDSIERASYKYVNFSNIPTRS